MDQVIIRDDRVLFRRAVRDYLAARFADIEVLDTDLDQRGAQIEWNGQAVLFLTEYRGSASDIANDLGRLFQADRAARQWQTQVSSLTRREHDVLACLVKGWSNKKIADALAVEVVTIKLHVRAICRKLGAANRTQAALIAAENLWQ